MDKRIILNIDQLHASIGQFYILQGVDLAVAENEIMVLLGRNGAGKTTTLRAVMGLVTVKSGKIEMNGESIVNLPPYVIAGKHVTLVPEDQGIFAYMTVAENIQVAIQPSTSRQEARTRQDFIFHLFPDLQRAWKRKAGTLSGGQKQMLSIARALVNDNKIIMLDEPSKGLAPVVINELGRVIQDLREHTSLLLVEQNLPFARRIGDRFSIISDGKTVLAGEMAALAGDSDTQNKYLGVSTGECIK